MKPEFKYNNGGRDQYFEGDMVGDCVTRAIAIATDTDYKVVYDALFDGIREFKTGKSKAAKAANRKVGRGGTTPRNGIHKPVYDKYLKSIGWAWIPTMSIGSGCHTHLTSSELPKGNIIVRLSKHLSCVIDGVINDTTDCSRSGTRCVYGYYQKLKS